QALDQWQYDLAATGESHTQHAVYGLIAWLVLNTVSDAWLGRPEEGWPTGLPAGAPRPPRPAPACRRAAPAHRRAALPGSRVSAVGRVRAPRRGRCRPRRCPDAG